MSKHHKVIWFFWYQGISDAPEIVVKCLSSWQTKNPDWKVIALNSVSLPKYLPDFNAHQILSSGLNHAALSDLIRINLLYKYGGIWVDATTYCRQSLSHWLDYTHENFFFAFTHPGNDRLIASWFLASSPQQLIIKNWHGLCCTYWRGFLPYHQKSRFWIFFEPNIRRILRLFPSIRITIFVNYLFPKFFKVYPYFWFHYLFNYAVLKYPDFSKSFYSMKSFDAKYGHHAIKIGLNKTIAGDSVDCIKSKLGPVIKLRYRNIILSKESLITKILNGDLDE
ncbi:capsular polysaccharide synthesis protein [Synechococcus sp. MU1655]|uniref:capsular polysaccharide synthesis protein n=1 Tax=Synechococcus sp. MU1655 TaxID=2508355 RepID=UPI0020270471|nr:capsular polysaccharide synthesis protein [Synechococcus sp. MU1655]